MKDHRICLLTSKSPAFTQSRYMIRNLVIISSVVSIILSEKVQAQMVSLERESVIIGNKVWMSKNLDVVTFRNGDTIPQLKSNFEWENSCANGKPGWCYYANNSANGEKYFKLYNWCAVSDPRGLAPSGWHIPTIEEVAFMINYLGGKQAAGEKMRYYSLGTENEIKGGSGFQGLPGGYRNGSGFFFDLESGGYWWTSAEYAGSDYKAFCYSIRMNGPHVQVSSLDRVSGLSIRCVSDTPASEQQLKNAVEKSSEVVLGSRIWMTKNLDVTVFRNGDSLYHAITNAQWIKAWTDSIPAYCVYNNSHVSDSLYGKLYNWFAINDERGLAPKGWHIASGKEWLDLQSPLESGDRLKNAEGWSKNGNGTNETNFSAMPGGYRLSNGFFGKTTLFGFWWTPKSKIFGMSNVNSYSRCLSYSDNAYECDLDNLFRSGLSARCVKENSELIKALDEKIPEIASTEITIGTQTWMTKNINVLTFTNGDSIPEAKTSSEWLKAGKKGQPAWCYYAFDSSYGKKYGKLYNWYAINDARGFAPVGWHVPTVEEWRTLSQFLNPLEAGSKMKSTAGWLKDSKAQNSNISGFSALPGGILTYDGQFYGVGEFGYWWGSTEVKELACLSSIIYHYSTLSVESDSTHPTKRSGASVRCIKN